MYDAKVGECDHNAWNGSTITKAIEKVRLASHTAVEPVVGLLMHPILHTWLLSSEEFAFSHRAASGTLGVATTGAASGGAFC